MNILIINAGSSSLKFQLMNSTTEDVFINGNVERIGLSNAVLGYKVFGEKKEYVYDMLPTHKEALEKVLSSLIDEKVITSLEDIHAIGHRVVHGGPLQDSCRITEEVIQTLEANYAYAPLHNPAAVIGMRVMQELLPKVPMVAVFDTSFHTTIPEINALYAIKKEYTTTYGIHKYGFHGTSHKYVSQRLFSYNHYDETNSKIITCHLGNGASLTAVENGKSINTTMGFTPLDGLVMGTRTGSVDPSIIPFLSEKTGKTYETLHNELQKESGLIGMCGYSDFRDIVAEIEKGNKDAERAFELFTTRIAQYIGQYYVDLGGLDALVFTAGIGEHVYQVRESICKKVKILGVEISAEENKEAFGKEMKISTPDSKVSIYVIPTNEELMIARETERCIR